jgi:hypothetical protein
MAIAEITETTTPEADYVDVMSEACDAYIAALAAFAKANLADGDIQPGDAFVEAMRALLRANVDDVTEYLWPHAVGAAMRRREQQQTDN